MDMGLVIDFEGTCLTEAGSKNSIDYVELGIQIVGEL